MGKSGWSNSSSLAAVSKGEQLTDSLFTVNHVECQL
ncbi:hypothetical protein BJ928_105354 [Rhizobium sp. WW_1]|nr:hypothetical protein BJ928_105354 [Rhizobium sp. WW_1]